MPEPGPGPGEAICSRSSPSDLKVWDSRSRWVVAWSLSWSLTCRTASLITLRACSAAVPATFCVSCLAVPATCLPWSAAVEAVSLAASVTPLLVLLSCQVVPSESPARSDVVPVYRSCRSAGGGGAAGAQGVLSVRRERPPGRGGHLARIRASGSLAPLQVQVQLPLLGSPSPPSYTPARPGRRVGWPVMRAPDPRPRRSFYGPPSPIPSLPQVLDWSDGRLPHAQSAAPPTSRHRGGGAGRSLDTLRQRVLDSRGAETRRTAGGSSPSSGRWSDRRLVLLGGRAVRLVGRHRGAGAGQGPGQHGDRPQRPARAVGLDAGPADPLLHVGLGPRVTAEQWQRAHNDRHHVNTNVLGKDNDLGYGIMRVDEAREWQPPPRQPL